MKQESVDVIQFQRTKPTTNFSFFWLLICKILRIAMICSHALWDWIGEIWLGISGVLLTRFWRMLYDWCSVGVPNYVCMLKENNFCTQMLALVMHGLGERMIGSIGIALIFCDAQSNKILYNNRKFAIRKDRFGCYDIIQGPFFSSRTSLVYRGRKLKNSGVVCYGRTVGWIVEKLAVNSVLMLLYWIYVF